MKRTIAFIFIFSRYIALSAQKTDTFKVGKVTKPVYKTETMAELLQRYPSGNFNPQEETFAAFESRLGGQPFDTVFWKKVTPEQVLELPDGVKVGYCRLTYEAKGEIYIELYYSGYKNQRFSNILYGLTLKEKEAGRRFTIDQITLIDEYKTIRLERLSRTISTKLNTKK